MRGAGYFEVGLASSRNAVERYRVLGDPIGLARALYSEAHALCTLGRPADGKSVLNEALPLADNAGSRCLVARILCQLGVASSIEGDFAAARGYALEGLRIFEALGATLDIGTSMNQLCLIELLAGNLEVALRHATDAIAACGAMNFARGVAVGLVLKADALALLGRFTQAAESSREGLALARDARNDGLAAEALEQLAFSAVLQPEVVPENGLTTQVRAARILGFVNARIAATIIPPRLCSGPIYDRVLAVLHDAIGAAGVEKFMAEGASMTEAQAIEEALT